MGNCILVGETAPNFTLKVFRPHSKDHSYKETVTFPDKSRKVTVVLVHRCSNSVTTPADLNTEATG